jgi:ectoine hydroxylase-related dioxygenase (phytanoyl-CoA dioxygenase family)
MAIEHFAANARAEDVAEALRRDGVAVIDRLVAPEVMDEARAELATYMAATQTGPDDFSGLNTRRTGGLIVRSAACRDLIMNSTVLGTVKEVLSKASNFQLHLTQVIAIGPGQPAQTIHRDQWAFDFFPFPKGYDVQCNTIWAMTDFTAENGATRVIPGSNQREDKLLFTEADTEPAEMAKGSVLFYTGSLYHGGGANHSNEVRCGVNITYAMAWLRQEENQYLTVPHEVARELPVELLRLMGYARGAYALGYVDDVRDPLDALRGTSTPGGRLGDIAAARTQIDSLRGEPREA